MQAELPRPTMAQLEELRQNKDILLAHAKELPRLLRAGANPDEVEKTRLAIEEQIVKIDKVLKEYS